MIEDWGDWGVALQLSSQLFLSINVSEEPVMLTFQLSGWLEPLLPLSRLLKLE